MNDYLERLTDAPEVYDGFGTKTLEVVGTSNRIHATGNPIRRVRIEARHDDWQTGRYLSGCYAYTSERVRIGQYTAFGDWALTAEFVARLDAPDGLPIEGCR